MTESEAKNYERIAADAEQRAKELKELGLNKAAAGAENTARTARAAADRVRHLS